MKRGMQYDRVIFTPEVIRESVQILESLISWIHRRAGKADLNIKLSSGEEWTMDSEDEFFTEYRKGFQEAWFGKFYGLDEYITFSVYEQVGSSVSVSLPSRDKVAKVLNFLEAKVEQCRLPKSIVKVFIGHGQNPQWRYLKDHLHEKHGLDVETYETGPRAGLTIKEVLNEMLTSSSFAILVLTGEDIDAEGELHARENVIHELGLFQGRMGWRRAIILLEEGVTEFSNIHGVNQIRFSKDDIQETFGEVLATIRREFP
jgi:hypothetical protein